MSSQENTSRRSRSRIHSDADRNTRDRSRVSNISIQATLGSIQDSMTDLHISNIPAERDHPPSYPNSLNNSSPANHPPRADSTTQSVALPYTTSSKATDKTQWMPGHRQTRSNVGNDINNSHIPTLASRNVGQSSSAERSGHGNQAGRTDSLAKVQITRPSANYESSHTSTGLAHQEPQPSRRVDFTKIRSEIKSYHTSSFLSSLSSRSTKGPHLYHTEFDSSFLPKDPNDKSHGYYLEYMKSGILEKSSHIPLFRPSPASVTITGIMPGDVGQFLADGSFQSLFNLYSTAQANKERFDHDPPDGFVPFQDGDKVLYRERFDPILSRGSPSGFELFQHTLKPVGWTYRFTIAPRFSKTVSALLLTSSNYRRYYLFSVEKGDEYFESQLKSWYDSVLPDLNKKDRNGRLVLVEGTYVTNNVCGILHYTRDQARKVKADDIITCIFEPKLYTTHVGDQLHKYTWNITGPGSSHTNLKRTTLEPAQHNGDPICFGIAARSLWEK